MRRLREEHESSLAAVALKSQENIQDSQAERDREEAERARLQEQKEAVANDLSTALSNLRRGEQELEAERAKAKELKRLLEESKAEAAGFKASAEEESVKAMAAREAKPPAD